MHPSRSRIQALLAAVAAGLALTATGVRADQLLVSGYFSDAVARYDASSGDVLGALDGGGLDGAQSVTRGPDGRLYVCSENTNRVLRYDARTGAFVDVFVSPGFGLDGPTSAIFGPDASGDGHPELYVASFNGDAILRYDGVFGAYLGVFVPAGSGGLNGPDAGMTFGPDGHLYVPSFWNNRVLRYDGDDGSFIDAFVSPGSGGLVWPRTVRFRDDGNLLVTSEGSDRVNVYDGSTGAFIEILLTLSDPTGMALAGDGTMYVASISLDIVNRYDATTGALLGQIVAPGAGGLDAATYVALLADVPGDVDGDGVVDVDDLVAVITGWGACPVPPGDCPADVDGSGLVDVDDLVLVLLNWS